MAQQQTLEEKEQKNQEYNEYVKQVTPTHSLPLNMIKAFITGGIICVVGQFILNVDSKNLSFLLELNCRSGHRIGKTCNRH